ncbi:hypothetical protein [Patulibacter minatonensis]|uniref:hypothetical protein n=1 Tax=Patulibacter minatonensis TaxID=298163 RepID=UPI00047EFA01|nr:hypothetical protein [Patulibacter minatonensis]
MPATIIIGLVLIIGVSIQKAARVAKVGNVPVRGGAVMTWVTGTLVVAVLPAFAALTILDHLGGLVDFDGSGERLGVTFLWVGICDVANVGRVVSRPRPGEDRPDPLQDRKLLFLAAMVAMAAYAAALLISAGFSDDAHVAVGVAFGLGFIASAATVHGGPEVKPGVPRRERAAGGRRVPADVDTSNDASPSNTPAGDHERTDPDDPTGVGSPADSGRTGDADPPRRDD